jgi:hypothetical protein
VSSRRWEEWRRLYSRIPLIGRWLRREAVDALARSDSPEAVEALAEAVARSDDEQVRRIALKALWRLASQGRAEAQEALCRLAIEHGHPLARKMAVTSDYAPRDEGQRALFYFLTKQWEKYEGLDFDQSLLRTMFEMADGQLQRRIVENVRRAGRVEWVGVIAVGQRGRRLGEMSDEEWKTALTVLEKEKQWTAMWRLAQVAPVRWSARLLRQLKEARWVPGQESQREGFRELGRLAERCLGDVPTLGALMGCKATLKGHTGSVERVAIGPRGRVMVSVDTAGTVSTMRLWRLSQGVALATLEGHTSQVFSLALSPDRRLMASAGEDRIVRLWPFPDYVPVASRSEAEESLLKAHGEALTPLEGLDATTICLAISPDKRMLASAWLNTVRLWRLPDGVPMATLRGHTAFVYCLAISPDGQVLASGGYRTVRLWRLPDGASLATLRGHTGVVYCLAVSPDGRLLASGSGDHTVRLWRLPDGAALATLTGHTKRVRCLAISPDGRLLASGSEDRTVRLWRLPDGAELAMLKGHTKTVSSLDISPDGRTLVSGSYDKTVRLWRLAFLRLSITPVAQMSLDDMAWVQEALGGSKISDVERDWLEFILALMRWQRRFDVEVEKAPSHIPAGEFDIELGE